MKAFLLIPVLYLFMHCSQDRTNYEKLRNRMVDEQIIARGVNNTATLNAMRKVPRHLFVPPEYVGMAYDDQPLPIGYGQTISQPFIVAYMTAETLPAKNKKALEIGTGSGYQAAVLSEVADSVYSIEIVHELAAISSERLKKLGYHNVVTKEGDGYIGWKEHAPFDIIIVTAAADHIPKPLINQLAENGRMIIPVGRAGADQRLILLTKRKGRVTETELYPVRFVPLIRKTNNLH